MARNGPLVILEDDPEDRELVEHSLREIGFRGDLLFFTNGKDALYYLMDTRQQPFLILSDINLPGMDGLELRRCINESHYLSRKSIPFIFFTTSSQPEHVEKAFDLRVQGFFVKPDNIKDLQAMLRGMIDYWSFSRHPNSDRLP